MRKNTNTGNMFIICRGEVESNRDKLYVLDGVEYSIYSGNVNRAYWREATESEVNNYVTGY